MNNKSVKMLKSTTPISELLELNKCHSGIIIEFWRAHSTNPNFVEWMNIMENKERKKMKKTSMKNYKETKVDAPKIDIDFDIVNMERPVDEAVSERVEAALREIKERFK